MVIILSYEDEHRIYLQLPSTIVVDGQTLSVKKVMQSYKLPDYVGPTLAVQFINEFGIDYRSIEEGFEEIDAYTFSLTKDYKTVMLITAAADDTEPLQKSITFTYAGSTIPDEPYKTIISTVPASPIIGEDVTVVYTRIIRGYNIVRALMRAVYDLADYEFPVGVTFKGQTRDVSELIGRETLCALQGTFILKNEYTSVHSFPEENTPVEALEIDIECNS